MSEPWDGGCSGEGIGYDEERCLGFAGRTYLVEAGAHQCAAIFLRPQAYSQIVVDPRVE